ncbi:MAG TPA: SHOCT domain-containing protein, partial [Polyangiales bacterium]|nr:SHOCT domain-containing protein [Polyangiales bacterium]
MQALTHEGSQAVQNLAQRYGVSTDAVRTLLAAVSAGGGTMAQFYHPELGGGGQWMRGGMTMVGDMFNNGLQATVSGLCSELSSLLSSQQV